jgi:uncharacterized repeat protein (TIGR03803 family)
MRSREAVVMIASRVALAGVSSLALVAFAPLPTLAEPTITRLASFTGSSTGNGSRPEAELTPSGTGTFYGTAAYGGTNNRGTIFEFNPTGGTITRLASFLTQGHYPNAALTPSGTGTFYGTTFQGIDPSGDNAGTIYEFNPTGGTITRRADFTSTEGSNPNASLTPSGTGTFYGTATQGGTNDRGTIFEFDPDTRNITLRASLGTRGTYPSAALTPSGTGTFYGTASQGGTGNRGTIFEFDPTDDTITRRASFTGSGTGNGSNPNASLTPSGTGTFYGTAQNGGTNNLGTIFEFNPTGGTITRLASFTGSGTGNGSNPLAALTPSGTGTFYGTASEGGADDFGTIFEFNPGTPPVPGPLPLLGAGAAFGWSRQLRRRVRLQQPRLRVLA